MSAAFANLTAKATVTVVAAVAVELRIAPLDASIAKGLSVPYMATLVMSDATLKQVTKQATWSAASTAIATFSTKTATGVGVGQTTVTATYQGLTASTSLTVTPALLQSIRIVPAKPTVARGSTVQLSAMGTYTDGIHDITTIVTWTSAKATVATINAAGVATGIAKGTSAVTATVGSISGKINLKVT